MNAIITGATKGIGKAVLMKLAEEGWNVAATSRHHDDLLLLQQEVTTRFPSCRCLIHVVDFNHKNECVQYGRDITAIWPEIDLLVNNAGIFFPGSVHEEADGILENMMQANVYGPYHLTRTILPTMIRRKKGMIINICSIASIMAYPNGGAYTMTKYALLGFSKSLREEMKTHGIKVTSVLPGATWTASWEGADYPVDRLMPAEDVANAILACTHMSDASVVEEILIRPQLGDL